MVPQPSFYKSRDSAKIRKYYVATNPLKARRHERLFKRTTKENDSAQRAGCGQTRRFGHILPVLLPESRRGNIGSCTQRPFDNDKHVASRQGTKVMANLVVLGFWMPLPFPSKSERCRNYALTVMSASNPNPSSLRSLFRDF